jgi:sugar lactone lactonase YvrE
VPSAALQGLDPAAALPGGDFNLLGRNLFPSGPIPEVRIAGASAPVLLASSRRLVARVPESAVSGPVEIVAPSGAALPSPHPLEVAVLIAENLHPVCNPAFDPEGNIVVTLSGSRGQKTPVSLFKLDANYSLKAWSSAITNPSGLAYDAAGTLYASSRLDGAVYHVAPNGTASTYAEGLGVATGIAFDAEGELYVGDRSGTIFKIDRQRNTFVFATLEPSIAAYHLAFGPDGFLYVAGPSTSSFDTIWRISPTGVVEPFFRGLGRPQGLAFEATGDLLVAASYRGRRGIIRIQPDGTAACVVSGNNLVGLAVAPGAHPALILATTNSLYNLAWTTPGLALPPLPPA